MLLCAVHLVAAADPLPNCSYPAIYGFGDSLTDVGNGIAAFPEKFKHAEIDPYGIQFPMHAADRYTDGKMFIDFLGTLPQTRFPQLRSFALDLWHTRQFKRRVQKPYDEHVLLWRKNGFTAGIVLDAHRFVSVQAPAIRGFSVWTTQG